MFESTTYAVVHEEPAVVFVAEDADVLGRVLALRLIALTAIADAGVRNRLRTALLEERFADALVLWTEATGTTVDVFPGEIWTAGDVSDERYAVDLQFTELFRD